MRKKGPKLLSVELTSSKKICGGAVAPLHPPKYANKHHLKSKIANNCKKRKKRKKNPIHPGKKSYICEALTPPIIPVAGSKRTLELLKICKEALCGKPEKTV